MPYTSTNNQEETLVSRNFTYCLFAEHEVRGIHTLLEYCLWDGRGKLYRTNHVMLVCVATKNWLVLVVVITWLTFYGVDWLVGDTHPSNSLKHSRCVCNKTVRKTWATTTLFSSSNTSFDIWRPFS